MTGVLLAVGLVLWPLAVGVILRAFRNIDRREQAARRNMKVMHAPENCWCGEVDY